MKVPNAKRGELPTDYGDDSSLLKMYSLHPAGMINADQDSTVFYVHHFCVSGQIGTDDAGPRRYKRYYPGSVVCSDGLYESGNQVTGAALV